MSVKCSEMDMMNLHIMGNTFIIFVKKSHIALHFHHSDWFLIVMPSAHGPIFSHRQKIGVKIGSCALTFAPI